MSVKVSCWEAADYCLWSAWVRSQIADSVWMDEFTSSVRLSERSWIAVANLQSLILVRRIKYQYQRDVIGYIDSFLHIPM